MTSVVIRPRDIQFHFEDSYNCCNNCICCPERKVSDPQVYINTNGIVEKYNKKKGRDPKSSYYMRSMVNLRSYINQKLRLFDGDPQDFRKYLKVTMFEIMNEEKMYASQVHRINNLMVSYFNLLSEEKNG